MTLADSSADDNSRYPRSRERPVLAFLFVALVIMSCIAARENIVKFFPRSGALYAVIGLPVNLTGLEIGRVVARIVMDNGRRVLVVDGDVANTSGVVQAIPAMQVAIRQNTGIPLYVWSTRPPRQKLGSGEHAAFSARLASPPTEAADVIIRFDRSAKPASTVQVDGKKNLSVL